MVCGGCVIERPAVEPVSLRVGGRSSLPAHPLIGGGSGVLWLSIVSVAACVFGVCCCDVVETSYEGHMVDALASRADEGRWSLR